MKSFSTYASRVVPHRSTRQAQWCLTSEFGWDLVFPPWYDRMTSRLETIEHNSRASNSTGPRESHTQIYIYIDITRYSSVGRAGDCNVNICNP